MASIGLPRARAETIRGLARAIAADATAIESLESLHVRGAGPSSSRDPRFPTLRSGKLAGIGPWTAAYVAMRTGRDPDALPASDLVLRKALAAEGGATPSAREVEAMAEAWRPWRAYAALHLWTMGAKK